MIITARSNERIKNVRALERKKVRDEMGLHLIEGRKIIREAVQAGMQLVDVFYENESAIAAIDFGDANLQQVSHEVMTALSCCETPQGIVATVKTPALTPPSDYPAGLLVVLDHLQDPGNEGTILRTADAMGACGVLLSSDCADVFSPKVLRSAMGSTYHLPIWQGELASELPKLSSNGFVCICGHLHGEESLPAFADRVALVIGNEGNGVSEENAALCKKYRLAMFGRAESLNASVATGIMLYQLATKMRGTGL